nr:hypothetical protein [Microbacterium sp. cx-59]
MGENDHLIIDNDVLDVVSEPGNASRTYRRHARPAPVEPPAVRGFQDAGDGCLDSIRKPFTPPLALVFKEQDRFTECARATGESPNARRQLSEDCSETFVTVDQLGAAARDISQTSIDLVFPSRVDLCLTLIRIPVHAESQDAGSLEPFGGRQSEARRDVLVEVQRHAPSVRLNDRSRPWRRPSPGAFAQSLSAYAAREGDEVPGDIEQPKIVDQLIAFAEDVALLGVKLSGLAESSPSDCRPEIVPPPRR